MNRTAVVAVLAVLCGACGYVTPAAKMAVAQGRDLLAEASERTGDGRMGQGAENLGKVGALIGVPEGAVETTPEALKAVGEDLDADIALVAQARGLLGRVWAWAASRVPELGALAAMAGTLAAAWRKIRSVFSAGTRISAALNEIKHSVEGVIEGFKAGKLDAVAAAKALGEAVERVKALGAEGAAAAKEVKAIYDAMKTAAEAKPAA